MCSLCSQFLRCGKKNQFKNDSEVMHFQWQIINLFSAQPEKCLDRQINTAFNFHQHKKHNLHNFSFYRSQ